jgi:hypothetical protein
MKYLQAQANNYINGTLPYNEGVSIFIQLSKNLILSRHFLQGYSAQREEKLKYELKKLTKQNEQSTKKTTESLRRRTDEPDSITPYLSKPTQENTPADVSSRTISDRFTDLSDSEIDNGLIPRLNQKRKELYRLRGHLHGQLHSAVSDEQRFTLADKIMQTQRDIDVLNNDIKFSTAGSIPSKYLKKDKTASEFVRIKNLRTYISRFEKKLEECESIAQKEKLEVILKKHKDELNSML